MQRAHVANILTMSRFAMAPLFAALYAISVATTAAVLPVLVGLWVVFLLMELTDILDGLAARTFGTITDVGKVLDPFADVAARLTYFICLSHAQVLPFWFLMIVLYRELGIILLRLLLFNQGIALAAKNLGKLKSWFYGVSAGLALLIYSYGRLDLDRFSDQFLNGATAAILAVFILTALLSIGSFVQYLVVFLRHQASVRKSAE